MKHLFLLSCAVLLWGAPAWAVTRYVDTGCSNGVTTYVPATRSCTGGSATSYNTIPNGVAVTVAGDILYIRTGTYVQGLIWNGGHTINSGTSFSNAVTIAAYPGETVTMRPSGGSNVIDLGGGPKSYIIFDRIIFDATNVVDGGLYLGSGTHHIRFTNGEVKNSPNQGIAVMWGGSQISADFNEFINMAVHNNGNQANQDHGFYIITSNNLIERCDIYSNAGNGIQMYGNGTQVPQNNIIRYNTIHNNATAGGGDANITVASANHLIYNNTIYGVPNGPGIQVAYFSPNNVRIYHNTIYNHERGIYIPAGASGTIIRNNIINTSSTAALDNSGSGTICTHNMGTSSPCTNNIAGSPGFLNAGAANFTLTTGSPAINAGVVLP